MKGEEFVLIIRIIRVLSNSNFVIVLYRARVSDIVYLVVSDIVHD